MEIETKVGPKGQVLIPKSFREWYHLLPGDFVLLKETEKGIIIQKRMEHPLEVLETLAKKHAKTIKIQNINFEEEIEERWNKIKK